MNNATWWLMVITAHVGLGWTGLGCTSWTNLTNLKMYCLMFGIILKSCPKLMTYLVSRTWVLMYPKMSSRVFSGVVVYMCKWIGCLPITNWFVVF
jgi:hypothetical protein